MSATLHNHHLQWKSYRVRIAEDTPSGTVLLTSPWHHFRPRITSGNDDRMFVVGGPTGNDVVVDVVASSSVDCERKRSHYDLVLLPAADVTSPETIWRLQAVVLAVEVDDVNEFRPRFLFPVYHAPVDLGKMADVGAMLVTSVRAVDDDAGKFGRVEYHLQNGGLLSRDLNIAVNKQTGARFNSVVSLEILT